MYTRNMVIVRLEKNVDLKHKNRLETKKADWKQSFVIGHKRSNIAYNNGYKYMIISRKVYDLSTESMRSTNVYDRSILKLYDHFAENTFRQTLN